MVARRSTLRANDPLVALDSSLKKGGALGEMAGGAQRWAVARSGELVDEFREGGDEGDLEDPEIGVEGGEDEQLRGFGHLFR